ncbi:uncharacterized protein LOC143290896 [Babylonia areolata]|uniref:uncharacterized protein LOC143290896 n=1 Tax=Babylonia areolata TaxID=304850 RepID=UPI003FD6A47A
MTLNTGKTVCLWLIVLGILAILTGSAAPFWLSRKVSVLTKVGYGLWFYCLDESCSTYAWAAFTWGDYTVWFYAVHGLAGVATLLAIVVLFLSLCSVFGDGDAVTNVGVMALTSGLVGIAAAVLFYVKPLHSLQLLAGGTDWAFIVFSVGTGVVSLFSIILLALPGSGNSSIQPM